MENSGLKNLIGADVAVFTLLLDSVGLFFDESRRLRISNLNSFWRLTQNGQIKYTSNDFYVRSEYSFDISFAPLGDELLDEIMFGEDDEEVVRERIFEKLAEAVDETVDAMKEILEGAILENFEESSGGDLKLYFSKGITLEVFSAPCGKKACRPPYELMI